MKKIPPPKIAAIGRVKTHDNKILEITEMFTFFAINPIPNIEPTVTWVVEMEMPKLLAKTTSVPVTKFAENPWP